MEKILVIEDDELIRENMGELFANEGYSVFTAYNGKVGLEQAKRVIPDIIISDIMMPEMDGFQVYKELRENPQLSVIPFIFLSALSDKLNHRYGMMLGADDYITKPFSNSELLEVVRNRLSKSKMVRKSMEDLKLSLVNSVPHEFFTPLNAVLGFSQLLIDLTSGNENLQREEILEYSQYIHSAGLNLLRLTRNYVIFSELTLKSAETNINPEQISPNVKQLLIEHVTQIISIGNRINDAEFSFENATVKIDKEYLKKIIEEILDNAFKFSKRNTKILIRGEIEKDFYCIQVEDFGVGMNLFGIEQIDSFKQFDRKKMEQSGLGLGLSIVKKILEISGGNFQIESQKNKGTKVILKIPLSI